MIYNALGEGLLTAFDVNGENLYQAYDIDGNRAFVYKYGNYTITKKYAYFGRNGQGLDIHNDVMAIWDGKDFILSLRDLDTGELITTLDLSSTDHGNDISFMQEYYDPGDEFPLLCMSASRVYRITREGATLVRTYKMPVMNYNNLTYKLTYGTAFVGDYMYVSGYRTGTYQYTDNNAIRIVKLDLTDLTENQDGTYTPAVISYADRGWLECIQGASYHDNLFWACCGMSSPGHIYGFNPDTAEIEVDIDLGNTGELEGLGWAYNDTDDWFMMVGAVGMSKYLKVTFSDAIS